MAFLAARNDALRTNPPVGDQYLTTNGSNWLWAVTAVFGASFLASFALSFRARAGERFFHYVFTVANLVGAIAYFSMASDIGFTPIPQANNLENGVLRQIFFSKYIYWAVSFPAALLALGILSGVSWATILYHIALAWIWVITYLVGAYTRTNYKWGFFVFGVVAHMLVALSTLTHSVNSASRVGIRSHYFGLAAWFNLLWLLYPIAWGLSDGGNEIGVTASLVWFGILDILMIPVLTFAFIFLSKRWDYNRLNIAFTQYGRVHAPGGHYPEKATAPAGTTAPAAGGVV